MVSDASRGAPVGGRSPPKLVGTRFFSAAEISRGIPGNARHATAEGTWTTSDECREPWIHVPSRCAPPPRGEA